MNKSHVIKLYPTKGQELFFRKSCGVARFSFNWALARWKELYEAGEKPSAYSLVKELNSIKREEFPWMMEIGKCAPQYAIHNLEKAFKNFFKKHNKYPRFKKKGVKDSFVAIENGNWFKQNNNKIKIPRLGWVRCAENLRFEGKIMNVTVKRIADMWFAVVNVEIPNETPTVSENQVTVGVDLGIKELAICSDGQVFENPKALKSRLKSLKRQQRWLDRKQKGSNNRHKQKMKVARQHYKIACVRNNALHQTTRAIVDSGDVIVIEDLNVKGLIKNQKLSQAISDVSFGEFRRQLEYKAAWQGKKVVVADRFYPSSKTCSNCGHIKKDLTLRDRIFKCDNCGFKLDRDMNAAINLEKYTGKAPEINASRVGKITAPNGAVADVERGSKFINN